MDLRFVCRPLEDGRTPDRDAEHACFDWETLDSYRGAGASARMWADFFPEARAGELHESMLSARREWHRDEHGDDLTLFQGISLGQAYRWMLWIGPFFRAYKFLAAANAAVEALAPSVVHCDAGVDPACKAVLGALAARGSFELRETGVREGAPSSTIWTPPSLRVSGGRALAARALNAVAAASRRPGPRLLVSYYHVFGSLLDRLSRGGAPLQLDFDGAPPKAALAAFLKCGARAWLEPHSAPDFSASQREALAGIRRRWAAARAARDPFVWNGTSLKSALLPPLDDFFENRLDELAWACHGLQERWKKTPPDVALLPYSGPPLQNLIEQIAEREGTPHAVLLHGLGAYDNVTERSEGGRFIVWTEEQRRLFRAGEGEEGRVIDVVANPNFDRYAGPRDKERGIGPIRRVLIVTLPQMRHLLVKENEDAVHARGVVDAALAAGDWEVALKLHPAESVEYYRRLLPGRKVRLLRDVPFQDCLEDCDLLVGCFSTVMMEAVVAGKPVLCVNLPGVPLHPPFDGSRGLPVVRDAAELAASFAEARRDPDGFVRRLKAPHPRLIAEFAGPVDGSATARLAGYLRGLARP